MDKIEVLINNIPVEGTLIKSINIVSDIEIATLRAEMTVLQNNYKGIGYNNDQIYTGYEDIISTKDFVIIKINDAFMFSGYAYKIVCQSISKNNFSYATVYLKTKSQDFYESTIKGKRSFKKGIALFYLIEEMLVRNNFKIIKDNFQFAKGNEIGVLFKVDSGNVQQTARLDTTTKQFFEERLIQDTGLVKVKIKNSQIYHTDDNNLRFLSRIANQYNINLTSDEYGNIVLYKPNLNVKIPIKLDTSSISNIDISIDEDDLYHTYEIQMKTQFKDKKTNTRQKERMTSIDRLVRDTRHMFINSRDTLNGQELQMKIDGFAGVQRTRSKSLNIECLFLSKSESDKTFFKAGDLIELDLSENPIFKNQTKGVFLIRSIEYSYNKDSFATKRLTLVEKKYFNAESLKVNN